MADKPTKGLGVKRRVKNPESFRERALKVANETETPRKSQRLRSPLRRLFRPLRQLGSAIVNFPLFKPLGPPLRFIGKIIFPAYFRNSWRELKDVTWPSWKESLRLTYAVLLFAIIFGTAVAVVDYGLDSVFKRILLK